MRHVRKLFAFALTLVMAFAMCATALAASDGSIKVTNATKGQTYEAYLVFTASPSDANDLDKGVSYTATAEQVAVTGFTDIFDTFVNEDGAYTVQKKSTVADNDVITFVKKNINALKQGSQISGAWTNNDTVTFSGLDYGYYYITSSLGSIVSIDTAGKDVSIYDKNETTPTGPDKDITAEDSSVNEAQDQTDQALDSNDAAVGSVESFQVDFNATNWVKASADAQTAGSGEAGEKVTEYNFIDTPTGLSIIASTVKVYANWGTDAQEDITSTITDIAVNSNTGVLTFTIPWVDAQGNHLYATQTSASALIPVHITYDATVLAAAATASAPNEVEVHYNNENTLGTSTTTTYTYKFLLKKTDENGGALEGAQFQLFYKDATVALKFTIDDNGNYRYDPNGAVTNIAPAKGNGTEATATIIGLDNCDYVLKEVVVPTGYNQAADQEVTGLVQENGTNEASALTITVENNKGNTMPSTGGIGTTIFYIVGGVMVAGAAIFLLTKRRVAGNE